MALFVRRFQANGSSFLGKHRGSKILPNASLYFFDECGHDRRSKSVNFDAVISFAYEAYRGPCIAPDGASPYAGSILFFWGIPVA
jgi:hypothetical protein